MTATTLIWALGLLSIGFSLGFLVGALLRVGE